jgi:hypothetical protein
MGAYVKDGMAAAIPFSYWANGQVSSRTEYKFYLISKNKKNRKSWAKLWQIHFPLLKKYRKQEKY